MKIGQDLYPYIMVDELKKVRKAFDMDSKVVWYFRLVYVPFGGNTHQSALKKSQPNRILHYGVGRTPKVEGHDMVGGILSKFTLKLWDVGGNLIWHIGPIGIMIDRIID
jgi:hypothetical protein